MVNPLDIAAAAKVGLDTGVEALQGLAKSVRNAQTRKDLEKVAKDFESVFLQKITDEMRKPVFGEGLFDSSAMEQTQGLFWSQLSQELGQKGGMGLWKQLLREFEATTRLGGKGATAGVSS